MPISFACNCGKKFRAKDEAAGRKVSCPNCNAQIQVPLPPTLDQGIKTDDSEIISTIKIVENRRQFASLNPSPMNTVGLVSLVFGLLSIFAGCLAIMSVISLMSHKFQVRGALDSWLGPSILLALFSGALGLLISRLGSQRIVRAYSLNGMRLAAIPLILALFSVLYAWLQPNYMALGYKALGDGRLQEAEQYYLKEIKEGEGPPEDESLPYAYQGLARTYSAQRRFSEAEKFFQRSLAIFDSNAKRDSDPKSSWNYAVINCMEYQAVNFLQERNIDESIAILRKVFVLKEDLYGNFSTPWNDLLVLSSLYEQKKDYSNAIMTVQVAMRRVEARDMTETIPYAACLEQGVQIGRSSGLMTEAEMSESLSRAKSIRSKFPSLPLPDIYQ